MEVQITDQEQKPTREKSAPQADTKRTKIVKSAKAQESDSEQVAETSRHTKRQRIEAYLQQRFRFRYNQLTAEIEYRQCGRTQFNQLGDYELNSICRQVDSDQGLAIMPGTLLEYLKSDFVTRFHPIEGYLMDLPSRQGTVAIDELAATVTTVDPDLFKLALTRWLTASVANVLRDDWFNHLCLVLTGDQGAFKTTWLNLLCPPVLKRYGFCGKIDLQSKDTLLLLTNQFIINLDDQLRELNKRDNESVKTLISHENVTIRRPYGKTSSYLSRIASFCGSINGADFLTDATGSRRFLPFEVSAVDINAAKLIDIDLVWAEAYTLYKEGGKYWFDKDETASLFNGNKTFQVYTAEYEMLHDYYEVVLHKEQATVQLTSTALLSSLQNYTKVPLSLRKLGEALNQSKAIRATSRNNDNSKAWFLRERPAIERESKQGDFTGF